MTTNGTVIPIMRVTVSFPLLSLLSVFLFDETLGDKEDIDESVRIGTCTLDEEEDVEGSTGNDELLHLAVIVTSHHVVLMSLSHPSKVKPSLAGFSG